MSDSQATEVAIVGGGCFWCLEPVFDEFEGVISVESGYAGGHVENPSYRAICTGATGHAEVVKLTFDPATVSFRELLQVFFTVHDPTTLNRQGADTGTQYRSAIFYLSDEQRDAAHEVIRELNEDGVWGSPIVTEVAPFTNYFEAEDYHQEYYANNPAQPYCLAVVRPKVVKFRKQFMDRLKKKAA